MFCQKTILTISSLQSLSVFSGPQIPILCNETAWISISSAILLKFNPISSKNRWNRLQSHKILYQALYGSQPRMQMGSLIQILMNLTGIMQLSDWLKLIYSNKWEFTSVSHFHVFNLFESGPRGVGNPYWRSIYNIHQLARHGAGVQIFIIHMWISMVRNYKMWPLGRRF